MKLKLLIHSIRICLFMAILEFRVVWAKQTIMGIVAPRTPPARVQHFSTGMILARENDRDCESRVQPTPTPDTEKSWSHGDSSHHVPRLESRQIYAGSIHPFIPTSPTS